MTKSTPLYTLYIPQTLFSMAATSLFCNQGFAAAVAETVILIPELVVSRGGFQSRVEE
jgi:hypothetical protein